MMFSSEAGTGVVQAFNVLGLYHKNLIMCDLFDTFIQKSIGVGENIIDF